MTTTAADGGAASVPLPTLTAAPEVGESLDARLQTWPLHDRSRRAAVVAAVQAGRITLAQIAAAEAFLRHPKRAQITRTDGVGYVITLLLNGDPLPDLNAAPDPSAPRSTGGTYADRVTGPRKKLYTVPHDAPNWFA